MSITLHALFLTLLSFAFNTHAFLTIKSTLTENRSNEIQHLHESKVVFSSPLLDEGYPPTIKEYRDGTILNKPLLVYLPGTGVFKMI